jgi:hypothetical protein
MPLPLDIGSGCCREYAAAPIARVTAMAATLLPNDALLARGPCRPGPGSPTRNGRPFGPVRAGPSTVPHSTPVGSQAHGCGPSWTRASCHTSDSDAGGPVQVATAQRNRYADSRPSESELLLRVRTGTAAPLRLAIPSVPVRQRPPQVPQQTRRRRCGRRRSLGCGRWDSDVSRLTRRLAGGSSSRQAVKHASCREWRLVAEAARSGRGPRRQPARSRSPRPAVRLGRARRTEEPPPPLRSAMLGTRGARPPPAKAGRAGTPSAAIGVGGNAAAAAERG